MTGAAAALRYRWLFAQHNLQVAARVEELLQLLRRAAAAGYNGVVLADYKLGILDRVPEHYFEHVALLRATAAGLGLALVPLVGSCGYDNAVLSRDPHLAACVPVRDAIFLAAGGAADVAGRPLLPGGAFEPAGSGRLAGWDWHGDAVVDARVTYAGGASARFDEPAGDVWLGTGVELEPFRQYHVSVRVRTAGLAARELRCSVLPAAGGPSLCHTSWEHEATQDWSELHAVFNSLDNDRATLQLRVCGARGGTVWLADPVLEEVGLLNVVRRTSCPVVVRGEDGTVCEEGRDFEPAADPLLGQVPWPGYFDVWHTPPPLRLTPGSRIRDGERLAVSFFHTLKLKNDQASASLVEPRVFEIQAGMFEDAARAFEPPGWFLGHDELRLANWDGECLALDRQPGQLLAAHVRRCAELARRARPQAEVFVWSDMFDPHHNAHDGFYLVRGTLAGSWEGLPPDMVLVNWNRWRPRESLAFFAGRGHRQILAGFYDLDPGAIRGWLAEAGRLGGANVVGAMYTTWQDDFEHLEAFAAAAWG